MNKICQLLLGLVGINAPVRAALLVCLPVGFTQPTLPVVCKTANLSGFTYFPVRAAKPEWYRV